MAKLISVLMIKNEEKIIARCIQSMEKHVDAFCICDTGSTDNTIEKINEYFAQTSQFKKPYKIYEYPWKNFGESRSESFHCCRKYANDLGWDWSNTYALVLDADMQLVVSNGTEFPRHAIHAEAGYLLVQENNNLRYENTRLLRLSSNWKCTGVTHEYWDGYGVKLISHDLVYIRDVGDGGCKDDKFPRDKALLEQGLIDDPTNVRYMFYLAQTLKDLGDLKTSTAMYRRRIKAGAWPQEVWYSMFQIASNYSNLKKYHKMEYWAMKAYNYDKTRAENIDLLTRVFRTIGQNYKAWHYMQLGLSIALPPAAGTLFIDLDSYHKNILYEKTILNYYVQPLRRSDSLNDLIVHMNNYGTHPAIINLVHYVDPLPLGKIIKGLLFPKVPGFYPSSISLLSVSPSSIIANVRFVNYKIGPAGNYIVSGRVNTRNFVVEYNRNALPLTGGSIIEMTVAPGAAAAADAWVLGVEDIRIYQSTAPPAPLKFIGTSLEYSDCHKIRQVTGTYNPSKGHLENLVCLSSPQGPLAATECEKNWVPFEGNGSKFIYSWHPLRIIETANPSLTYIVSESPTPGFFENVRGSSNFLCHDAINAPNCQIGIVHVVQHLTPRKYYHMVVVVSIDPITSAAKLQSYSLPFYFYQNAIEYVLGIALGSSANELIVAVSSNDADPSLCTIDLSQITKTLINK